MRPMLPHKDSHAEMDCPINGCPVCMPPIDPCSEMREALAELCDRVERDLREPDKLLCAVLSARRALL